MNAGTLVIWKSALHHYSVIRTEMNQVGFFRNGNPNQRSRGSIWLNPGDDVTRNEPAFARSWLSHEVPLYYRKRGRELRADGQAGIRKRFTDNLVQSVHFEYEGVSQAEAGRWRGDSQSCWLTELRHFRTAARELVRISFTFFPPF